MSGFITDPGHRGLRDATVTADLEDFVQAHRSHGHLAGDTGNLTPNGYRLTVACTCGLTFHRWVTAREAADDLAVLVRRN
jgi:hypothetical protein